MASFFPSFLKHLAFQELLLHSFSSTSRAGTETWFRYSRPRPWNTKKSNQGLESSLNLEHMAGWCLLKSAKLQPARGAEGSFPWWHRTHAPCVSHLPGFCPIRVALLQAVYQTSKYQLCSHITGLALPGATAPPWPSLGSTSQRELGALGSAAPGSAAWLSAMS